MRIEHRALQLSIIARRPEFVLRGARGARDWVTSLLADTRVRMRQISGIRLIENITFQVRARPIYAS